MRLSNYGIERQWICGRFAASWISTCWLFDSHASRCARQESGPFVLSLLWWGSAQQNRVDKGRVVHVYTVNHVSALCGAAMAGAFFLNDNLVQQALDEIIQLTDLAQLVKGVCTTTRHRLPVLVYEADVDRYLS